MKRRLQSIAWICVLAIGLHASPAAAQSKHRLSAGLPPSLGEFTLDPNDSSVEIVSQNGVPGTDPNSRFLSASVDSASGVLVVSGSTDNLLMTNRSRAVALVEQLMDMDSVPIVIDATLILNGSASGGGGLIQLNAMLEVGECSVSVARDFGTVDAGFVVSTNGCNDSSFVSWNTSGGEGALHITSTWSQLPFLGEVYMEAQVNGDFGGILGDIPTGEFSHSGQLSIETSGGGVVFFSDSFLTVPEPDAAAGFVAALGALALLGAASRTERRNAAT